jgi:L-fuculose-phosphate aldolase
MNQQTDRPCIHPRDEIVRMMERIYGYRMTTTSGGNLSVRDAGTGDIWITPASIDKGSLTRHDIVRVRPDGTHEGRHRPSSELPFHRAIYRARPDIGAIVHAHPVALVAFSIVRKVPDTSLYPQAAHVCGPVGYAPYELPGSEALGGSITEQFAKGFNATMLENHGVVVGGVDLQRAFERFETLEFVAKTLVKSAHLRPPRALTAEQQAIPERPRGALPEFDPPAATTREMELRRDLADFIRRGYRQRLLTSTGGSFSARLDADTFLISPYNHDRGTVEPHQFVLVQNGRRQSGPRRPSRAVAIHEQIYRAHPNVQSIVNATPVNATAFSICGEPLDARTIPESYLFLADVGTVPFAEQFGDGRTVARIVSPERPVALLENGGALVLGKSVLNAFDRLEVLESTAEAVINGRALGPLMPMDDAQIGELRTAFGML